MRRLVSLIYTWLWKHEIILFTFFRLPWKLFFYVQLRNAKKCKTAYMSLHDMNIKFTQPPLIFTCTGNGIIQNFISESLKQHYIHVSNSIKDRIKKFPKGGQRVVGEGSYSGPGPFIHIPPPPLRFPYAWLYTSSLVYNDQTV